MSPFRSKILKKSAYSRLANRTSNGISFKRITMLAAAITLFFAFLSAPIAEAQFNFFKRPCNASDNRAENSPVCKDNANAQSDNASNNAVVRVISTAADIIAVITGVAAVIMIMVGGFNYITSGGNAEQAANGRRKIIYSLIGLAVVALAWTITRFIINNFIIE